MLPTFKLQVLSSRQQNFHCFGIEQITDKSIFPSAKNYYPHNGIRFEVLVRVGGGDDKENNSACFCHCHVYQHCL